MSRVRSSQLYERACRVMPGGVNSPVRAFKAIGGTPLFYHAGSGAHFTDEEGTKYLDFVMSWGPLILGHAHPVVIAAVHEAVLNGLSFGAPCAGEVELAERVVASYPGIDMVRFVSSGTEAVMSALRLARGVTGRPRVLKFDGCYHGHGDSLLVKAGSGLATLGLPSSAGVPECLAELTTVIPLDDEAAIDGAFSRYGDEIAAAIIEPVPANSGLLIQRPEVLRHLAAAARRHGALLIFDEVITGFRLGLSGAAGHLGITPDLVTFGKVVGGGMPVGAYAGSREVMEHVAPLGAVYQAGTLSGNPIAMAAGLATLETLESENAWEGLESLGVALEAGVNEAITRRSAPVTFVRCGSLFWFSLQPGQPPRRFENIDSTAASRYASFHRALLDRGVYLAPSAFEVGFLSTAHTPVDLERAVNAVDDALGKVFG